MATRVSTSRRAKATSTPRKQPRQDRSKSTVDTILEAAARILRTDGFERATTNRIAALAGVSVGSLYQYFPSKSALVAALLERHRVAMIEVLRHNVVAMRDAPIEQAVRAVVDGMVAMHAHDPELHRVLTAQAPFLDAGATAKLEMETEGAQYVRAWLEYRCAELPLHDLDTVIFVLVRMVESLTHAAVLEQPSMLRSGRLTEAITTAVLGYLRAACSM